MKKQATVLVVLAVVLTGCATGTQLRSIPIVERGGPLTPGVMRDSQARQAQFPQSERIEAEIVTQNEVETVRTYAVPHAPIGGITVSSLENAVPTYEDATNPISNTGADMSRTPIGGQTSLAADEQLAGPVLALLTTAKQQQGGGDLNSAASSLERAQRIAPREPQVFYRLAEVRLEQGDAAQAEQLAQQGLRYSDGRPTLQAGLWELIAKARAQQGNHTGAQEAQRRARVHL